MRKTLKSHQKSYKKNKTRKRKDKKDFITIDSDFESGNIEVVSLNKKKKSYDIQLKIEEEPYIRHTWPKGLKYQNWFYFRANHVKDIHCQFTITNLQHYNNIWKGYKVSFSYDNKTWERLHTKIVRKNMVWNIKPTHNTIWFAYYPPYPNSELKKLVPGASIIGRSNNNLPIYLKKYGHGPTKVWAISGQHPGETINAWILEGFIKRMLERKKELFNKYTFYIIPNANPDGNNLGYWYVNADGITMNREWTKKLSKSPEVRAIKTQLEKYGHDIVFDLHGDEGSMKHFLVTSSRKHPDFDTINKLINKKIKNFQLVNFYGPNYLNDDTRDTLDYLTNGITVEGALKHKSNKLKTIQQEPIDIGAKFIDVLEILTH